MRGILLSVFATFALDCPFMVSANLDIVKAAR